MEKPQVEIRLQSRLPLALLGLALVAAFLLPDKVWTAFLLGVGGLIGLAYGWARLLARHVQATRHLRFGWVSVGDRLSEQFELVNTSPVPALWAALIDESTVPGYDASVVQSLGAQGQVRWRRAAICQQRGVFQLGPWQVQCGDPFGIFTVVKRYEVSQEVVIHPPVYGRLPIPLPAGSSNGRITTHKRAPHATTHAATVRRYHPQDPFRWIHWPTTARRDTLFTREFDQDAAGDLWLLLDMEQRVHVGHGPDGTEEHSVLLAAALAARAIRQNRAVGLALYGQPPRIVPPGMGQGQLWRLLRLLAVVQANGQVTLARALQDLGQSARQRHYRGATAVIITPNIGDDWLPSLAALTRGGMPTSVVLLDRHTFGDNESRPGMAAAAANTVQALGTAAHVLPQGALGQPAAPQKRSGFWEFRVTRTGRVITVNNPLERGEGS